MILSMVNPKTSLLDLAVKEVQQVMINGGTRYLSSDVSAAVLTFEDATIDIRSNAVNVQNDLTSALRGCPSFISYLENKLSVSNESETVSMPRFQTSFGIESSDALIVKAKKQADSNLTKAIANAAYFIMAHGFANGSGKNLFKSKINSEFDGGTGVSMPNFNTSVALSYESFEPVTSETLIAAAAINAGINTVSTLFEDTWFKPRTLPVGQHGVKTEISIPYVFRLAQHDTSKPGSLFQLERTSLYLAPINASFLQDSGTNVIPYAVAGDDTNEFLLTEAECPTHIRREGGFDYSTRAIKAGSFVNLIGISAHEHIISLGAMDITDQLEPTMGIGRTYNRLKVTTGVGTTPVVATDSYFWSDLSNQVSATFIQRVQGPELNEYYTDGYFTEFVTDDYTQNKNTNPIQTNAQVITAIKTALSIPLDEKISIAFTHNLKAEAVVWNGKGRIVQLAPPTLVVTNKTLNTIISIPSTVTIEIDVKGWDPDMRRSNMNMRQNGLTVDIQNLAGVIYKIRRQTPLSTFTPISDVNPVQVEHLALTASIRNFHRAIETFKKYEAFLSRTNGEVLSQQSLGGVYNIKNTYIVQNCDLDAALITTNNKDQMENLRTQLCSMVNQMASKLYIRSNYGAACWIETKDEMGFEVLIQTDPIIEKYLMTTGDPRTLGNSSPFVITSSLNEFFRDKIYISFRRKNQGEDPDPLSWGFSLKAVPIILDAQVSSGNSVKRVLQYSPMADYFMTCPILGRINVVNLYDLWSTDPKPVV